MTKSLRSAGCQLAMRVLHILSLAAAILAGTVPAMAQTGSERIASARQSSRVRLGPFYFRPTLLVHNIGVEENVFVNPDTEQAESDFTFTVTPRTRVYLPIVGRALFSADVSTGLVYYREYASERAFNPAATVTASWFVRRLTLNGSYGFSHVKGRPNFEVDLRTRQLGQSLTADMEYRLGSRTHVGFGAYRSSVTFDDRDFLGVPIKETLDRSDEGIRFTARKALTPKTAVSVRAETVRSRFELTPARNSDGFRVLPGISFAANALVSGSASVGVRRLEPKDATVPGFTGIVGAVGLTYTLLGATQFTGRWERELDYSVQASSPYYVTDTAGLDVRRQIIGRLDVILGARQTNYKYRLLSGGLASVMPSDHVTTYVLDLGFRLSRDSRIGLALTDSTRKSSTRADRNYRNRNIGLTFRYGQ